MHLQRGHERGRARARCIFLSLSLSLSFAFSFYTTVAITTIQLAAYSSLTPLSPPHAVPFDLLSTLAFVSCKYLETVRQRQHKSGTCLSTPLPPSFQTRRTQTWSLDEAFKDDIIIIIGISKPNRTPAHVGIRRRAAGNAPLTVLSKHAAHCTLHAWVGYRTALRFRRVVHVTGFEHKSSVATMKATAAVSKSFVACASTAAAFQLG